MIILQHIPINTPEHYLTDNKLILDFCPELKRTKKADQPELDRVSAEGVLGFFLINTEKNQWALKDNFAYVQAWQDNVLLPQTYLRVFNRTVRGMEVELVMDADFWSVQIRKIKLCSLTLGTFVLNESNLRNNWTKPKYNDGDSGLYFPLINYGNWNHTNAVWDNDTLISPGVANEADFRPWFHILFLLQKGFCSIGYKFRSPILETDFGRRLITYVLVDLAGDNSLDGFKVNVYQTESYTDWSVGNPNGIPGNPSWLAPTKELQLLDNSLQGFDNGFYTANNLGVQNADGSFNYFFFTGLSGEYTFELEMDIDSTASGDTVIFNLNFIAYDPTNAISGFIGSERSPQFIVVAGKKTIRWTTRLFNLNPKYRYFFTIGTTFFTDFGEYVISNAKILAKPKTVKFQPNMQLILKAWISCNYEFDKLLAGIIHIIQGRLISDESTRTVWLLHPNKLTLKSGEEPEPFFNGQTTQAEYDCSSYKETYRRIIENRYLFIGFKTPDDDWVKLQNYDSDNPIFAKKLDFGNIYEEVTSKNYNPFFEASDNYLSKDLQPIYVGGIESAVNIPACWDNTDHKQSTKLSPRILYAYGPASQYRGKTPGGIDVLANWRFKNSTETVLPYAYQLSNESIGINENAEVPEVNLVYGERANDITSQFWKLFIQELIANIEIDFELILTANEFEKINFRRWVNLINKNKHYVGRLTEITDYTGSKADVTFRPTPVESDNCGVVYDCNNDPNFEAILNNGCLIVNKLPGINSQIQNDIISWRRIGGNWFVYNTLVCGCGVREYLDFITECSGTDFIITNTSDCVDYLGSVTLYNSDNEAVDFWGVVNNSLIIPTSVLINLGTSYIVATRSSDIGTLSKSIKIIAFGTGCGSLLIFPDTDRTNQLIYYPLEVKREVTFSDACPSVSKRKFL